MRTQLLKESLLGLPQGDPVGHKGKSHFHMFLFTQSTNIVETKCGGNAGLPSVPSLNFTAKLAKLKRGHKKSKTKLQNRKDVGTGWHNLRAVLTS